MGFTHYSTFTVKTGQVPSTLTDFAVLLKPTDNRFRTIANGGNVADSNGYDLRPYSDSSLTTALTFELVPGVYNASTGTFEMWVKVPSLSDGYVIYLAYGDSALNTDGSSTSTWVSAYDLVAHLHAPGGTLSVEDSSQGANDGSNSGVDDIAGRIDGGGDFSSGDYIDYNSVDLSGGEYTISMWATRDSGLGGALLDNANGGGGRFVCSISGGNWGGNSNAISYFNGTVAINLGAANSVPASTTALIHITLSASGNSSRGYVDGSETGNGTYSDVPFNTAITVGNHFNHSSLPYVGTLDEVRMRTGVLTPNWITTEYNNQTNPANFYDIGTEQTVGTFHVGSLFALFQ